MCLSSYKGIVLRVYVLNGRSKRDPQDHLCGLASLYSPQNHARTFLVSGVAEGVVSSPVGFARAPTFHPSPSSPWTMTQSKRRTGSLAKLFPGVTLRRDRLPSLCRSITPDWRLPSKRSIPPRSHSLAAGSAPEITRIWPWIPRNSAPIHNP